MYRGASWLTQQHIESNFCDWIKTVASRRRGGFIVKASCVVWQWSTKPFKVQLNPALSDFKGLTNLVWYKWNSVAAKVENKSEQVEETIHYVLLVVGPLEWGFTVSIKFRFCHSVIIQNEPLQYPSCHSCKISPQMRCRIDNKAIENPIDASCKDSKMPSWQKKSFILIATYPRFFGQDCIKIWRYSDIMKKRHTHLWTKQLHKPKRWRP